jgi:hypothetical protein
MTTKQFLTNQRKTSSEQAFTNAQRRTFIGGALAALLASHLPRFRDSGNH